MLILILLPVVFLLPPGAGAGEIVGGHEAKPHSRPYMAFLEIQRGDTIFHCGGFLVAENFALTAAHCQGDSVTVVLGAHNLSQRERSLQVIRARRQIPHPQYDRETRNNDIMLLQLSRNVTQDENVAPIGLPDAAEDVEPGTRCSVAGWGSLSTDGKLLPIALREVDVVVIPDDACPTDPYGPYHYYNHRTMMCVGNPAEFYDSAKGDSGGPLVCGGTAQGIVSWGNEKAPGVYTKISAFLPWINSTMKKLQDGAGP